MKEIVGEARDSLELIGLLNKVVTDLAMGLFFNAENAGVRGYQRD